MKIKHIEVKKLKIPFYEIVMTILILSFIFGFYKFVTTRTDVLINEVCIRSLIFGAAITTILIAVWANYEPEYKKVIKHERR